jgi:uncharacterized protein (TIGR03382 family)
VLVLAAIGLVASLRVGHGGGPAEASLTPPAGTAALPAATQPAVSVKPSPTPDTVIVRSPSETPIGTPLPPSPSAAPSAQPPIGTDTPQAPPPPTATPPAGAPTPTPAGVSTPKPGICGGAAALPLALVGLAWLRRRR